MRKFLLVLLMAGLTGMVFAQSSDQNSANPQGAPAETSGTSNPPPAETVDTHADAPQSTDQAAPAEMPDSNAPAQAAPPTTTPPASSQPATTSPPATPPASGTSTQSSTTTTTTTTTTKQTSPSAASNDDEDEGDAGKAADRVKAAATVLDEIEGAPDSSIPEEVLGSAQCVAVVPSLLKGGFVLGARYGRGIASCHTAKGWSAPAFFTVKGGSFGLQIGGQAVDLVMLIMNEKGMRELLSSKFQLGADASVAAGPVGRHAEGTTDWKMRAEVLTYSRARGVFAGITLNGASIKQDKSSTRDFYGRMVPFRTALTGEIPPPENARPFLDVLSKWVKAAK
jgi:SH3 domain-containing YSC84-like protein 1